MGQYSIKELEALTGIKAHTLRIWEKRHNIIEPQRSSTNIRTYSDDDLKQLLNVSILYNQGYKISKIANLTKDELLQKIADLENQPKPEIEFYIDQFTISMVEMNENKFQQLLSQSIMKYGFEETMIQVIYPFLKKIGILWLSNNINPAQEHFISNLIRQKIIVAIDNLDYTVEPDAETVVLFLPENEMHELGLLFFHYLVKKKGYKTYYLGQNVPFADVIKSVERTEADIILGAISYVASENQLSDFLEMLDSSFPNQRIIMTGKPIYDRKGKIPQSLEVFKTPSELNDLL